MFNNNRSVDSAAKAAKAVVLVFAVIGILLLIASTVLLVLKINQLKGLERTEAVIIALEEESSTTVSYQVDGRIYRYRFSSYSSSDRIGDTLTLAYDKNDPGHPYRTGFMGYLVPAVLGFIGLVFTFLGLVGLRVFHRKPKEQVPWEMT